MDTGRLGRFGLAPFLAVILAACGGGSSDEEVKQRAQGLSSGSAIPVTAATQGMFGQVKSWPLVAVHGVLLPDGRVLSYGTKQDGTQTGYFVYDIWDPADDSHLTLTNGTGVDLFCSGQLVLPDSSNVIIAGGDNWTGVGTTNTGNNSSTLLNTSTLQLTRAPDMNRARWYATATTLLNGETYIQGGTSGEDRPEVRGTNGTFRLLTGVDTSSLFFEYPRNFVAPDGRIFGFDQLGRTYYIDPTGAGTITMSTRLGSSYTGRYSGAAMFAPGRILQYGGGSNQAVVIDINGGSPVVTPTASMLRQRLNSVPTILPTGEVVVTGGSRIFNQMTDVSYEAEIWNPVTGQWTAGASMTKPRLYHGNALLLPDATVLVFSGGAPAPEGVPNNLNAEIYYPPYLFAGQAMAPRPSIALAPTVVDIGRTASVTMASDAPISRVTLVKTGSATHGWNMEQRFVDLPFVQSGTQLSVQIPSRAADIPPGMWMMFAINDAGVPSHAKLMRVNVAGGLNVSVQPTLASPGDRSTQVNTTVDMPLSASDPNGDVLTFSASGLPPGLSIDGATGRISGVPTTFGTYLVTVAANDGLNSTSVSFVWTVVGGADIGLQPPAPQPPTAAGTAATFTASAAGGVEFRWDFGDGTQPTPWSPTPTASYVFPRAGVFYVSVEARNSSGAIQRETIIHTVYLPGTASAPVASSNIVYEPRATAGDRLWVVNPDNDSVSVFDVSTNARVAEIAVGAAPRTLARAPDGNVWVVNRGDASVSVISASTLAVTRTIALPRASLPYGIAFAQQAGAALVALEATGTVVKLDAQTGAIQASVFVGPNPRHLAVAGDGRTAYVSRFITPPLPGEGSLYVQTTRNGLPVGGEVVVVDASQMTVSRTIVLAHSNVLDGENQGRGIPNYLGAPAISPDGTQAFVPSKMDNVRRGAARDGLALNFQNTVRAISSRIDMATQAEDLAARIDHDNASLASAAAFDSLGVYLFVALETSREVAVLDAHSRQQLMRIDVGLAPQGLVVSPDRRTLYVMNFMSRTVSVFDLTPLVEQGTNQATLTSTLSTVASEKLNPTVLRGKQLFYDARDPRLSRDRYMSCATCHNDGGHDGRVWDLTGFGEGLRNTISLRGRAGGGHGRLHWSNNFDEVQDFEGQIRALAGGTGLMSDTQFFSGTRNQPLGTPKAGLSADLDALAAYVASLDRFDATPHRNADGTLTASALAGRQVFTNLNCAACHGGGAFTGSASGLGEQNIGTLKLASGQRLGSVLAGIDVPTLRDVWNTAPYLHDGSAPTLEAAVRAHSQPQYRTLGAADMSNLLSYLLQIGREEAAAPSSSLASLDASVSSGAGVVNLTAEGVADWIKWGRGGMPGTVRKSGVTPLISDYGTVGGSTGYWATQNDPRSFSWSDGEPEANASGSRDTVRVNRTGQGFSFLAPADPQRRTLKVHVGGTGTSGRFSARIVGAAGPEFVHVTPFLSSQYGWVFTLSYSADAPGQHLEIRWTQESGSGNISLVAATLSAPAGTINRPPLLDTPADQSALSGQSVSLQVNATDPDGDSLAFAATGLPPGLSIDPATGAVSGQSSAIGRYAPTIEVRDGRGGVARAEFSWAIGTSEPSAPTNQPPTLMTPTAQTSFEGQEVSLPMSATDADGDPLTFSATGLPPGLAIGSGNGIVSGRPTTPGTFEPVVTVSDGRGGLASATFQWEVREADVLAVNVLTSTAAVDLSNVGTADWIKWGHGATVPGVVRKAGVAPWISTYERVGSRNPFASDSSDLRSFSWADGNPTQSASGSKGTLRVNIEIGSGFRIKLPADTQQRTLRFFVGGANSSGRFTARWADTGDVAFTHVTPLTKGQYVRTLDVSLRSRSVGRQVVLSWVLDGIVSGTQGNVSLVAAALSGEPNHPPSIVRPADQTTDTGTPVALNITASDPDAVDTPLTFTASGLPPGLSIDGQSGVVTGTPSTAGSYAPTIVASDLRGGSSSVQFQWTVQGTHVDSVAGTVARSKTSVNLSNVGLIDWVKWGVGNAVDGTVRRTGSAPVIGSYTTIRPTAGFNTFATANHPSPFSWNNGTPTTSATDDRSSVRLGGLGNGFRVTVSAGTQPQTVRLYLGGKDGAGRLTARIVGSSAPAFVHVTPSVAGQFSYVAEITFGSASAGQQLEIFWTVESLTKSNGNVSIAAAAL